MPLLECLLCFTEPDTESVEDLADTGTNNEVENTEEINDEGKILPEGAI